MELSFDKTIEFIVTSGIYLVIIGKLFRVMKKNSSEKKYSNDTVIPNIKDKKRDDRQMLYTDEPRKGMKKQSVFTSMMQQVDKISGSFEITDKSEKITSKNLKVQQPITKKTVVQNSNNERNINQTNRTIKQDVINSKIYEPISEINDMNECIHEDSNIIFKFRKNEMKKAIIMKEILDKPRAYKQARR